MLIKANEEKIRGLTDALYSLAVEAARSCYPAFFDGIKTKQDFTVYVQDCAAWENYTSLFFINGGEIHGLIQFFTIPAEKYLQLCGWYIFKNVETAFNELFAYIKEKHAGYELYFGFSDKNKDAALFLRANGFSLIENDNHDALSFSDYLPPEESENIRRVRAENFRDFRGLHKVDSSVYWNSDRILEAIDKWNIYIYYEDGEAVAAIYETYGEIYGVDFRDGIYRADAFKQLVIKVLNELKSSGKKDITFFNDNQTQQAVLDIGFKYVGRYNLYYKKLI